MTEPESTCDHTWPMLDPNEEDQREGRTHVCYLSPQHGGEHRCVCGEWSAR